MTNQTTVEAPDDVPTIVITREFDAPPAAVYAAHTDPDLFAAWIGPRDVETRLGTWDCRTGGSWTYTAHRDGERLAGFFGSFHEVRPNERVVQTFTYDGAPDETSLETLTLTELPGGRTRLRVVGVVASFDVRRTMIASGMEGGVREGYEKLDALLTESNEG